MKNLWRTRLLVSLFHLHRKKFESIPSLKLCKNAVSLRWECFCVNLVYFSGGSRILLRGFVFLSKKSDDFFSHQPLHQPHYATLSSSTKSGDLYLVISPSGGFRFVFFVKALKPTKFSPSLQQLIQKNFFVSEGAGGSSAPNDPPGSAPDSPCIWKAHGGGNWECVWAFCDYKEICETTISVLLIRDYVYGNHCQGHNERFILLYLALLAH